MVSLNDVAEVLRKTCHKYGIKDPERIFKEVPKRNSPLARAKQEIVYILSYKYNMNRRTVALTLRLTSVSTVQSLLTIYCSRNNLSIPDNRKLSFIHKYTKLILLLSPDRLTHKEVEPVVRAIYHQGYRAGLTKKLRREKKAQIGKNCFQGYTTPRADENNASVAITGPRNGTLYEVEHDQNRAPKAP